MDLNEIRELAELMNETGLSVLEITEDGRTVKLGRESAAMPLMAQGVAAKAKAMEPSPGITRITSPIVGVFYSAASPDAKPFVSVGDKVSPGDVLCIIEAMKLMNEIIAEEEGEITEICVKNGEIVEFGQTLFCIR